MNIDTLTSIDETNAALLAALERIEKECVCPACQIAVRALEEHKARLVELTKDNSMDNTTPPKWIAELVNELLELVPGVSRHESHYSAIVVNWTDIISTHAPDAEALAVAIEYLLARFPEKVTRPSVAQLKDELEKYRSRFPKE